MQLLYVVTVATDKLTYIHTCTLQQSSLMPTYFSATTVAADQAGTESQHPCLVARRFGTYKLGLFGSLRRLSAEIRVCVYSLTLHFV
jgi:hypothetical protein